MTYRERKKRREEMLRRNRYRILAARIFINLFALAALALVALAVFYLLSELQPQLRDEERCDVGLHFFSTAAK